MRRALDLVAIPVIAGMIYAFTLRQAARDAAHNAAHRWWPKHPIDHP
jgi:hypothetical protein